MFSKLSATLDWATSLGGYAGTGTKRFLRYSTSGTSTFALDFLLLWFFSGPLGMHYIPAAIVAYILSTIVHYFIVRNWAFTGTKRQVLSGYFYFTSIAFTGLLINVLLLSFFVEILVLHVLLSRFFSGVFVGIWNYSLNLFLNFKTQGRSL